MGKGLRVLCGLICLICAGVALLAPEWLYAAANRDYAREWKGDAVPPWTGMLTLGIVGELDTGRAGLQKWAAAQMDAFQADNFGVYVEVVKLQPEEVQAAAPDILLYCTGSLEEPTGALAPLTLAGGGALQAASWQGQSYGLPVAYGAYAVCVNDSLSMTMELDYPQDESFLPFEILTNWAAGGVAWQNAGGVLSVIAQHPDEDVVGLLRTYGKAGGGEDFAGDAAVCLLADEAGVLSAVAANREGKGPALGAWAAGGWTDRVWYAGVAPGLAAEKQQVCESAVAFLRGAKAGKALSVCGLFSPTASQWMYAEDAALGSLEVGLRQGVCAPSPFGYARERQRREELLARALAGDDGAAGELVASLRAG